MVRALDVVDYHTEGEPMRIVTGGVDPIPGATMLERSEHLRAHGRDLLGFVLLEPRGHAAMCGAILTDPVTAGADAGVLFIEPIGPVHMCGHGAMAVAAMLVDTGRVPDGPGACATLDTPAGLVRCRIETDAAGARRIRLRNVPSFSVALDRAVDVPGLGRVPFDLAYGGHFYAIVPAASVGLRLEPASAPAIVEVAERIRAAVEAEAPLAHPERPGATELLYVQLTAEPRRPDARYRNAVVVAPGGIDRSPCGTGTSARMANLHARGLLGVGEPFGHESIIGTLFEGRIAETCAAGDRPAIVPEIAGRAFAMGRGTLVLDPRDPFPGGFAF